MSICWRLLRRSVAPEKNGLWTWGHEAVWSSGVSAPSLLLCACWRTSWFYQLCKSWLACYREITPIWGQRELITPILEHLPPCTKLQLFVIQYDLSMLWKPLQFFNYLCHNGLEIEACPYGLGLWNCVIVTQVSSLAVIPHWCCRHTCLKKEEDVCFNYVYIHICIFF